MTRRRRTILLALLALALPLPAFALTGVLDTTTTGPASISVSTSLDSCGVLDDGIVCTLDVSFSTVADADSYTATVTRADGSVIDYGAIGAGGSSLYVPYVGAGTYSVKVTAYGAPETTDDSDGLGDVVATGTSHTEGTGNDAQPQSQPAEDPQLDTQATGRGDDGRAAGNADGAPQTQVGSSDPGATADEGTTDEVTPTPEPTCTTPVEPAPAPPTPPVEPPADNDPANPDEDADGIPDDQERVVYQQQLDEYRAALAAQEAAPPATGC
jgi:hypothetical protein